MSLSTITLGGQTITVVSLPARALRSVEWNAMDTVALAKSIFTGQSQRQKWFGADLLSGTMTWPPLTQVQTDDCRSFLMQARGIANAFRLPINPLQPNPRGTAAGRGQADNTQNGGNLPGSEYLGTKGWTPNAQGVLLRGDAIEVNYRGYFVLDDVNADSAGKALLNIWPTLRETPTSDGGPLPYTNATCDLLYTISRSLGNNTAAVVWSSFQVPFNLPADAVIQGIYPVIIASAAHDQATQYLDSGSGFDLTTVVQGTAFPGAPGGFSSASYGFTEFHGASIGTALSALAGQQIRALLNTTLNVNSVADQLLVTAVGYAVYYASNTPSIDQQIAAPFAVPTGQGLAWALPFALQQSGVLVGGTGIFDPSNGSATGTAATPNGALILNGARTLCSLAKNDRTWSGDYTRLSNISFSVMEYR